ncbi:MAG: SCP2 sterol-binding domain-containing protein [Candidatus Thorarchaeota archaeon]|nr:SCP2 sterol-binding domain-containing protein [Candidatus Thorarchaeota archaeon]MCK5238508.1 SCP2 sterol-binding domain-containing protein [Candidatus Thorarchaeota archaeon]
MTKERILNELRKLSEKFENPKIQRRFKGYHKTIQFTFPDLDVDVFLQIGDATVDAIGVGIAETDLGVTMDSTVFFGIIDKTQSPMAAYSSGKLKTKGDVPDLLKLQKLLL